MFFSTSRLLRLMKMDLYLHKNNMLILGLAIIVLLAVMPIYLAQSLNSYFMMLYVGGFIMTSLGFRELHDAARSDRYLLLPGSRFEKFLAKWLLTSLCYMVALFIVYYSFVLISSMVYSLIYGVAIQPTNVFQFDLWGGIARYMVIHSIVLLGAISFQRFALIKTAIVIGLIVIVLNILKALFANSFLMITSTALANSKIIAWTLLMLLCWYLSYLKLGETESN